MYLGLDVGAGLTKLVCYPDGSPLEPAGPPKMRILPTSVFYRGLASAIPAAWPGGPYPADSVRCDGFPLMLDAWSSSRVPAWGGRTPAEVTRSFLRGLLEETGGEGGVAVGAQPDSLVVATPPHACELQQILAELGRAPIRGLAAPVAAVAYLRRQRPELAAVTRFVVCDIGAGSMSLALCIAGARGPQLTDSIRLTGASAWSEDTFASANSDDRLPTLAECLVTALARRCGAACGPIPDAMSVQRWRALEVALARDGAGDWPAEVLRRAPAARGQDRGAPVLRIADLEVSSAQLLAACAPLADRAASALAGLLDRQAEPGWRRAGGGTGARIVLIGGLSALGPVRAALVTAAGLESDRPDEPGDPGDGVIEMDGAGRIGAVASGAGLLAAGLTRMAAPGDRYPHALRLAAHRVVRDRVESADIELAAAAAIGYDQAETMVAGAAGEPLLLTVKATQGPAPLPVQIVHDGTGTTVPAVFQPAAAPPPGVYRLGLSGGTHGVTIVLHNVAGGRPLRYVLAEQEPAGSVRWDRPFEETT